MNLDCFDKHISYSYAFSPKFTYPDRLQDSVSSPTGWGLQKDSELLEFVNYHLIKMTETGIVNRFRRDAESGEREGPAALERVVVLGFENVAFPLWLIFPPARVYVRFAPRRGREKSRSPEKSLASDNH